MEHATLRMALYAPRTPAHPRHVQNPSSSPGIAVLNASMVSFLLYKYVCYIYAAKEFVINKYL